MSKVNITKVNNRTNQHCAPPDTIHNVTYVFLQENLYLESNHEETSEKLKLRNMVQLPWRLSGKERTRNVGDPGLIPVLERSPGEGNGHPFQYSCMGHPMDRGA